MDFIHDNKNYNGLDLLKFICSILVILIHKSPFKFISNDCNYYVLNLLTRIAVPLFSIMSGYIFYEKASFADMINVKQISYKQIKRLLWVLIPWNVIYLIICYIKWVLLDNNKFNLLEYIRRYLFWGPEYYLWYFSALIFTLFFFVILLKKLTIKQIYYIAIICYIIGLLGDSYKELLFFNEYTSKLLYIYEKIFINTRNGLFFVFPFFVLGTFLTNIKNIKTNLIFILFSISMIGLTIEITLLKKVEWGNVKNMMIFLIPLCISIFLFFREIKLINNKISFKDMRNLSVLIYVIHPIILQIIPYVFAKIRLEWLYYNFPLIQFPSLLLVSLLISIFILLLSKNNKLIFLNKFM